VKNCTAPYVDDCADIELFEVLKHEQHYIMMMGEDE